jgi:hypothetical protein
VTDESTVNIMLSFSRPLLNESGKSQSWKVDSMYWFDKSVAGPRKVD